ncbi:hypothetical protein Hanom_Chr05g00471591 [Helianthus anomalus]
MCICYDCSVTNTISSSDSRLSDDHDPMAVVSDDEVGAEPKIFTSDSESDPEMMSEDDNDFSRLHEDPFVVPILVHDHLIIGHPDGEHVVAPILAPVPLMAIPPEDWPFDDLFDDDFDLFVDDPPDDAHGDGELDEDVAFGLRCYATDFDDDIAMSPDATPADPEPIPAPEPLPDHDPIPFGIPDIAPLIPDPVPAPVDLPVIKPFIPPPAPADVAPFHPVESDVHRVDLPIVFLQDIPAPHPGEDTSGQQPSHDPHVSAAFPYIPQSAPSAPVISSSLDEPFRWFPPYTMPISDPDHPSHLIGYTRDELLLSL